MTDAASDAAGGRPVDLGAITLWVDDRGPADGDAIVLLAGADSPGFRWTPAIVGPLLEAGYRVVRFDHRDAVAPPASTRRPPICSTIWLPMSSDCSPYSGSMPPTWSAARWAE